VILSAGPVLPGLAAAAEELPELADLAVVATEDIPDAAGAGFRARAVEPGQVAFLQYTSGSTAAPRGVAVTHANLMDNQRLITAMVGHTQETVEEYGGEMFVSWLPMYHDMGLIGPVLNTVHIGATATLFSPLHFLQQPQRWPAAISRFRPHTSGGPNVAYELCLRTATPEILEGLDLGRWRVAFNGAEPVRAATLRRFTETFAPAGFRAEACYPCYGLAEATLMVTGGAVDAAPTVLPRPQGGELVGCGTARPGVTVLVVDPEQRIECPAGEVGEIWVAGGGVARGYWRNALATREVFGATLAGGGGGFLRTGDLGFLREGELFVTGRLKDLLVIDGRNHYPQDLELLAEAAHPALRPGCSAAFSVDDPAAGEQPVIIAEASPAAAADPEAIVALIRSAVGAAHGVSLRDVVLIEPGTIPKTSSGKIQRRASRAAYLDGTLSRVGA
jgi:acyl-CoA synthetase (AMP-forming)/AMP-acid ligase II